MHSTKFFLFGILVFSAVTGRSNAALVSADSAKIKYTNQIYAGGLFGKSQLGVTASFALVNGIRYKSMLAGVGIGYDDYSRNTGYYYNQFILRWKTMPVFASVSFDFAKIKNNALYVQVNGGYSWMWLAGDNYVPITEFNGGTMINPGVGFRIVSGQFAMTISVGYKWQKHDYQYSEQWSSAKLDVSETIERVMIQIGFGIF